MVLMKSFLPLEVLMGFLYTYDQVRRGEVPTLHDFLEARDLALDMLRSCPAIVTGGVMGSVAHGTPSYGSDLDLITICRTAKEREASDLLLKIRKEARQRRVMADIRLLTVHSGREGEHFFGPSFLITWRKLMEQGAIIGPPPQLFIWRMEPTIAAEMTKKVERNFPAVRTLWESHLFLRKHQEGLDLVLRRWHRANIRPLHFYIRLGRWLLWWRYGVLEDDRSPVVIKRVLQDPTFAFLYPLYREAHDLQKRYDLLILSAIYDEVPQSEYKKYVWHLVLRALRVNVSLMEKTYEYLTLQEPQKQVA